jgi:peptidoglycan biosynthesis protein MviN/MurJ (putative lipid II flippase)
MDPASATPHRSGLVSFIAWCGIIGGGFALLGGLTFSLTQPSLRSLAYLLAAIAVLTTSLGLRNRREWARVGFIYSLVYSTVMGLVGALTFHLPQLADVQPTPGPAPAITQAELDAMAQQMRPLVLGAAVVASVINLLLIAYLSRPRVRREFDAESAA